MTPLSPAVISKLPIGLLGFFGIKNGGQYPQSIVPAIQPTLELGPILAANYNEQLAVSPIAALGFVTGNFAGAVPAVVPAGELWWVSSVSILPFTGVGDTITGTPEVRNLQTGTASVWHRALGPEFTQGASLTRLLPCNLDPKGFWAQPGDTFGFWYSAVTNASGTAQTSLQLRITRFPA